MSKILKMQIAICPFLIMGGGGLIPLNVYGGYSPALSQYTQSQ